MDESNSNYMITFAKKWRNHGGGSGEDILTEFGLSQAEYFRELQILLDECIGTARDLSPALRHELQSICRTRLNHKSPKMVHGRHNQHQ